jgi:hypothetical protein
MTEDFPNHEALETTNDPRRSVPDVVDRGLMAPHAHEDGSNGNRGAARAAAASNSNLDGTFHDLFTSWYPGMPANNVQSAPFATAARVAPRFLLISCSAAATRRWPTSIIPISMAPPSRVLVCPAPPCRRPGWARPTLAVRTCKALASNPRCRTSPSDGHLP